MALLPTPVEVSTLLTTMLRRTVKATAVPFNKDGLIACGLYSTAPGQPAIAVWMGDLAFAAQSGSAFSMIPPDAVNDAIKAGHLDEFMQDNYGEVLNVLSRLYGEHDHKRITLTAKLFPPEALCDPVAQWLASPAPKLSLAVDIEDYGKGRVALGFL